MPTDTAFSAYKRLKGINYWKTMAKLKGTKELHGPTNIILSELEP